MGSTTLFNAVFIRPEQVVRFLPCSIARSEYVHIFTNQEQIHRRTGKKNWGGRGHIFARRILKLPDGSKMNKNIV